MPFGTPSEAYTKSVPDKEFLCPAGKHILAFYIKCVSTMEEKWVIPGIWKEATMLPLKKVCKPPEAISLANRLASASYAPQNHENHQ